MSALNTAAAFVGGVVGGAMMAAVLILWAGITDLRARLRDHSPYVELEDCR